MARNSRQVPVLLRVETPSKVDYCRHGGILPSLLCVLNRAGGVEWR